MIARRHVEAGPTITLAIECKDKKRRVGVEEVNAFINRISAQRTGANIDAGVLVSASGFSHHARTAAVGQPHITLLSWDELTSEVLDVRQQLQEFVEKYGSPRLSVVRFD